MDENQAEMIAKALGGSIWQSGGDIWLVTKTRNDGHLIVISDEAICEYDNNEAFEKNKIKNSILLNS